MRCRRVRADRLEPWYRDVKDELEAARKHKRWAERQWVKTAKTVNKQIFNAAKRLVAKIVHKAKYLFFGNEIALSTSSRQLFNICDKLIGRKKRSSHLPSTYHMTYLMFSMTIFFRKSSLFVLILISRHCH